MVRLGLRKWRIRKPLTVESFPPGPRCPDRCDESAARQSVREKHWPAVWPGIAPPAAAAAAAAATSSGGRRGPRSCRPAGWTTKTQGSASAALAPHFRLRRLRTPPRSQPMGGASKGGIHSGIPAATAGHLMPLQVADGLIADMRIRTLAPHSRTCGRHAEPRVEPSPGGKGEEPGCGRGAPTSARRSHKTAQDTQR